MARFVVAGCGHGLESHIPFLIKQGHELAGIFDPSLEARKAVHSVVGSDFIECDSFEELLRLPNVDFVVIASPDAHHPDQLLKAVRAKKHVICEKPLATTFYGLAKVQLALWLAKKYHLVVESCHPRRVQRDPYGWVKTEFKALEERFGSLEDIRLDFSYHRPRERWKAARSLLLDHFVHEIDFVRWLTGDRPLTARKLVDSHDKYVVSGVVDSEVTFTFIGTRKLSTRTFPESIYLRFERGDVTVNAKTGVVTYYDHEDQWQDTEEIPPIDYDHRFSRLASQFTYRLKRGVSRTRLQSVWVNNASALMLVKAGWYRYKPKQHRLTKLKEVATGLLQERFPAAKKVVALVRRIVSAVT